MKDATLKYLQDTVTRLQGVAEQIRIDTNEVVATNDHIAIIKHYDQLRLANEHIKEARESLSEIADLLSKEQVPSVMAMHSIKTITVVGVGRVTVSHRFSCSMLDKDMGMSWLKDNGHEGLIQPTVNSSTLSAFAKNMLEVEGKELPPEIFKVGTMPYTSITKVK